MGVESDYAWRALPSLKAKLALGEDYLRSDIFDGFNYVGGSASTDDQMLPPNLRGYAPDISGVAHTTAKVTVSQMGRGDLDERRFRLDRFVFRILVILSPVRCIFALKKQNGQAGGTGIRRLDAIPHSPRSGSL
ncbi:fimbria/pilus outer membrane usher protein [Escherichia coli]